MKRTLLKLLFIILFLISLPTIAAATDTTQTLTYHPAKAADISDRSYEPAVINLLDSAKESIIISMYVISADPAPVKLLLNDLAEALDRGVTVEIYLNTQFKTTDTPKITAPLKPLTQKGAKIYLASPLHMLHDKLIIIDSRYVIEASTNWSVSALKANYESATIIDSPGLAKEKTIRLRNILLKGMEGKDIPKDRPDRPKIKAPLPAAIKLPKRILEDRHLFPRMRSYGSNRTINAYLLLTAESARINKDEFFLDLEDFAAQLRMPKEWKAATKRRQVLKTLKKLSNNYKLIKAAFTHGKDAYISLIKLQGETFTLSSALFDPDFLANSSPTLKTVLLIDLLLKDEGCNREDFSRDVLYKRFFTTPKQFRKGRRELEAIK